ncbi:SAYSVFN motif domain containing 1 [Musca autumnalis]|uniref:SAYSVFN motif domain containing 1 n=1 Tax=Musca autumnalis TaxID=221902 RepID=UPI003CEF667C
MEAPEDKLQKYRNKKKREEKWKRIILKIRDFLTFDKRVSNCKEEMEEVLEITNVNGSTGETRSWDIILRYSLRVAYVSLWIILYIIAIEMQFGIVYLMLSGLVVMYLNTRTGPKSPGEISAYSVFNKDFKSIDGSLKAEQFEREMGIR